MVSILQNYFKSSCPLYEMSNSPPPLTRSNPTDVLIPFEELTVKEKLGSGASADVYHG